jgi:hypothetical protein
MEGRATGKPAQDTDKGSLRQNLALIGLLLLVAVALRAWHLRHTEVAARDSIGYIRYAWQLDHHPWIETIRSPKQEQHFGYPFAILAASHAVRHFVSGPETMVMQLSAQLASSLTSVLLVVPMFLLGRDLFGRWVSFWATLIFQCLPAAGRLFADGLSEGLFLLLAVTALLGAVRAFRVHAPGWFAVTGAFGALAYLVRPEGALIVVATGLVLLGVQIIRSRRAPWRRFLACAVALSLTAVVIGSPLYLITGKLTQKPTAPHVWNNTASESASGPPLATLAGADSSDAPLFAVWIFHEGNQNSLWGVKAVVGEFIRGCYHVLWLPMALGLWWFRDRFRLFPGALVMFLISVVILVLLWRVASLLGYVSDRHLLIPILCGSYWAVAAVPRLISGVAALASRLGWLAKVGQRLPSATRPCWTIMALLGLIGAALPKTLEPLHVNRRGFREAGLWIATHSQPWDEVLDPYSWSHYYSGKVFLEDQSPAPPPGERKVCYVVIEQSGPEHVRLTAIEKAMERAAHGRKVWERATNRGRDQVDVLVFETPVE